MFCSRRYLQPNAVRTIPRLVRSSAHATPNPPIDLDPSLRALLKDVDMSLTKHKAAVQRQDVHRELEVISSSVTVESDCDIPIEHDLEDDWRDRKSPAARFGTNHIGAVVLPSGLQKSINSLISSMVSLASLALTHAYMALSQNRISTSYAAMHKDCFWTRNRKGLLNGTQNTTSSIGHDCKPAVISKGMEPRLLQSSCPRISRRYILCLIKSSGG